MTFLLIETKDGEIAEGGRRGFVRIEQSDATYLRLILDTGEALCPDLFIELQPEGWAIYAHGRDGNEGAKVVLPDDGSRPIIEEL